MSEDVLAAATDPLPDTVIHLAAETGGCSEEDGLNVNVVGTRRLLRSSIDRGIKRFVLASSIAAPIGLTPDTMPAVLPIDDDHPCLAKDAYGLSKALMEEVAYYFHRTEPDLDITLFRIGVVLKEDTEPATEEELDAMVLPLLQLSAISIVDVVTAMSLALERPASPGVHRINLVAPSARSPLPMVETLSRVLGSRVDDLDLSFYQSDETRFASPFAPDRLRSELGFIATVDPRTMTITSDGNEEELS
jgi:nucleoside-diphosphate-sugar epimerase